MAVDDFAKAIAELNTIALAFDTSGPVVARELETLVKKTAHLIEANAKTIVPVDTGATRSSIGVDFFRDVSGPGFGASAVIGPQTEYAPHLEFGTKRMAPRAFMGPSADRYIPDFVAAATALAVPPEFR